MNDVNIGAWRKSSRCGSSTCVEVAPTADGVMVRDSKNPERPALAFEHGEWNGFLDAITAGDFADL